jgi:iron complex outermembrane recepter protein
MVNAKFSTPAVALAATLVVSLNSMAADAPATAASADAVDGLPEIAVTAERFGATVQTTPIAVTALSQEMLSERQVTSVEDVGAQIPGIVITPSTGSSNSTRIVLRGVGQEQGGINFDPAVGIYIDGIYQPRINGSFFDFFDTGSLEVLRGPQGTLYGRNTSGGAIKVETRRPTEDWSGAAEVTAGNWSTHEEKAFISGPIVPGILAFSVSAVARYHDGYFSDPYYDHRIGNMKRDAERVKLLFTPTEKFEATLSVYAMQDYSDPGVGVPLQVAKGVVDPYATGSGRDLSTTEIFGPMGQNLGNKGASLNATYTISPDWKVNSITGYGDLRIHSTGSILWLSAAAQATGNGALNSGAGGDGQTADKFYSQEFNTTYTTDLIKAVGGVYYFHEHGDADTYLGATPNNQDRLTKAYAAYAQGTLNVGAGVGITAGLRQTKEDAAFTQFYRTLVNYTQSLSDSFKATTPKFGVDWQISSEALLYASYTKGFKSGGVNPVPPNANTGVVGQVGAPIAYDPEKVNNYEVGAKLQTDDRRVRLNIALFDAMYKGLQLPVFFPGTSTSYTSNASAATIKGIELEPTWQPFKSLTFYGNMSYTTGKYTQSFICSGATGAFSDCSNRHIKGLIPNKTVLGAIYSPDIPFVPGQFSLTGQGDHTGHYFNNVANEGPLVQTDAATIYNASLRWTAPSDVWYVTVEGKNITNKLYVLAGLQLASAVIPSVTGYINDPRTVLVRIGAKF